MSLNVYATWNWKLSLTMSLQKSFKNIFEKEILLEDKMSRIVSNVEIDLECKLCLDYKHEIKMQNEKGKIIS